jgi:L-ascorbate metabolism protein UlaG (beta-lactamase superfamily)
MKITAMMSIVSAVMMVGCGNVNPAQEAREMRIKRSPQFNEGKFTNPIDVPAIVPGSKWKLFKKYTLVPRVDPKPKGQLPIDPLELRSWPSGEEKKLVFSWLGHSSLLIGLDGKTVLVDPVLGERASPVSWFGPKRFHPAPVHVDKFPHIDVVLITHDHYDHLEKPTIQALAGGPIFLVPLGIGALLENWGVSPQKIVELDWWEHHRMGPLRFTATPAVHYASRGLLDRNKRLWCSWSMQGTINRVFISGDSGFFDGFKKIGTELGPFDVTFLKIGSYDETWKYIHMNPEEAVIQHQYLRGHILVPLHWATFDLGLHPWYEPIERLLAAAEQNTVKIATPRIGQLVDVRQWPSSNTWWRSVDSLENKLKRND